MQPSAQSILAQLRQNPLDSGALQGLRQQAEENGEFASYAEGLELYLRALAESDGDPVELGRLHFELGNLYRDRLSRQDRAITHYRTAIDFDAAQRPAIVAARGIYQSLGKWDQVAKLLVREADSLPEGPKRAATLQELARVYKDELSDPKSAARSLREASGYVPNDLHVRHELATLLLEQADRESDGMQAEELRREAAEVLCAMARAVSDDYAFAYIEAALDAVPDHAAGLELLETVAPRVGRADTIAPRWVAALQMSPDGPLSRDLRLKLAKAYHSVGQEADAKACLEPLLARGDFEAERLSGTLSALPEEDLLDEADLVAESSKAQQMASDIDALRDDSVEVASPLDDLARLGRGDATIQEPLAFGNEDVGIELIAGEPSQGRLDVDSGEVTLAGEGLDDDLHAALGEELTPLPTRPSSRPPEARFAAAAPGSLFDVPDEAGVNDDDGELPGDVTPVSGMQLPEGALVDPSLSDGPVSDAMTTSSHSAKAVEDLLRQSLAEVPHDPSDASDPHAEVTQPRGGIEIPPEARRFVPSLPPEPLHAGEPSTPKADLSVPFKAQSSIAPGPAPKPRLGKPEPKAAADLGSISQPIGNDLGQLQKELEKRIRFRDRRGAAEIAEQMLLQDGTNAEAIAALEDHYRTTRDFKRMRELAMRIAREAALPIDTRVTRLREAAMLSESKLGDVEGTMVAWRELLALLPGDEEGNNKLRKLYTRHTRWDDLAQMIDTQAKGEQDLPKRAALLRELGLLQRDKRKAPDAAIEAFQGARAIDAGRADDEVVLSELFVAAGRHAEAALAYEARLGATEEPVEKIPLLRTLAELYETELGDDNQALASTDALLVIAPRDSESLDRLERIGERTNQPARVIDALTRKLATTDSGSQAQLHARIGEIALHKLSDPARAAQSYRDALMRAPTDLALQSAAEIAFERAERRSELTELFVGFAHNAREPAVRANLLRKVAEREEQDGKFEAAISAYEQLLIVSKDQGALAKLVELLRRTERHAELTVRLDALANLTPQNARDLRLERAKLFADKLSRLDSAKTELARILGDIAPNDLEVLTLLADYAQRSNDLPLYAKTEEQRMELLDTVDARIEVAEPLAKLLEERLKDEAGALRVLEFWMRQAPSAPQPYLRAVPLYERTGKDAALLSALDALATLAMAEDEAAELLLRAARVAMKSGDYEGAWNRLVPRVVESDDAQFEAVLKELAQAAGRGNALAELYVGLAQRPGDVAYEKRRWLDAAQVYEGMVQAPDKALEAMLRALAKDAGNVTLLDEADRLAELAKAWPRLTQVYDALARREPLLEGRIRILMRLSERLEQRGHDLPAAFERAALAFQLDATREETYLEAKRLARAADKLEELLALHERRSVGANDVGGRMEAMLEACAVAAHSLSDLPRATGYLSRAVAMIAADPALLEEIEAQVRELDARQPPIDGRGLTFALAGVYKARAEDEKRTPELAARLLQHAATLYADHLDDRESAYRALERAATIAPTQDDVLDGLVLAAERAGRFEALSEHFQKLSDDAIDSTTASGALRRLGALFRGPLHDPNRAAEVYKQLVLLKPRDSEASAALRACLKEAGRHKDLLIALDRELAIAASSQDRIALLQEAAETWEVGLGNRFEARDAWKKVIAIAPDHAEAIEAMARLGSRPSIDDSMLMERNVVVLPEDLNPSVPPPPVEPEPAPETVQASEEPVAEAASEPSAEDEVWPELAQRAVEGTVQEVSEEAPVVTPRDAEPPPARPSLAEQPFDLTMPEGLPIAAVESVEEGEVPAALATSTERVGAPEDDEDEVYASDHPSLAAELGASGLLGQGSLTEPAPPPSDYDDLEQDAADEGDMVTSAEVSLDQVALAAVEAEIKAESEALAESEAPAESEVLAESEAERETPELEPADVRDSSIVDLSMVEELDEDPAPARVDTDPSELPGPKTDAPPSPADDVHGVPGASRHPADTVHGVPGASRHPADTVHGVPGASRHPADPPLPWAEADRPSQPTKAPSAALLADLESLDADVEEEVEEADAELETIEEDDGASADLGSLDAMVKRGGTQPPKPPSRVTSMPPPVPPRPTAPPPVPNAARPPVTPPPPPRRGN